MHFRRTFVLTALVKNKLIYVILSTLQIHLHNVLKKYPKLVYLQSAKFEQLTHYIYIIVLKGNYCKVHF